MLICTWFIGQWLQSPASPNFQLKGEDIVPMDLRGVWRAMEECHRLGLARMIGVSNFTTTKLQELLAIAEIPPAVNQVCNFVLVKWIISSCSFSNLRSVSHCFEVFAILFYW
jgi:diketogulonate reductase-like aldo/keto reductase